jgi:diguanylate cyclase (GGDEF)-like protein
MEEMFNFRQLRRRVVDAWLRHRAADASAATPSAPQRQRGSERFVGAVTGLASVAALAVALAFPAAYLVSAADRLTGVLEVRAQLYADNVSDAAAESPQLYNAMLGGAEINLDGLAIASPDDPSSDRSAEWRRVFAADGRQLLEVAAAQPIAWPALSSRAPVLQNGHGLGAVEITRSLRPQLLTTAAIAAGSFALGLLLLIGLRTVPLRLMHEALDRASFLSAHDQLTGLPNRTLLADRLEQALSAACRANGTQVAMFCLDLDHFKHVNDTLGHAAGDALLRAVAIKLRHCLRESDTLARLGGDEFAVIQTGANDRHDVEALAARLIETVHEPLTIEGQKVFIGLSVGIALNAPGIDSAELTKQADIALYQAKAAGRDGFCIFAPEMNAGVLRRQAIENDLRGALERDELEVHYQPQIDLATGAMVGAEALMRWTRPGHGATPPGVFIPIAEETGLIVPMGAWLLGEACREAVTWPAAMRVAVNVSPLQVRVAGFLDTVRGALAQTGLDPHRLELEVTEGILIRDTEETLAVLSQLRAIGVRLAMDDFGTGYASLGYLQKIRFDKIKIDRSFIQNLGLDPNAEAIVRAVVGLSDALGISTNAEGVENKEQAAMLRALGCREAQGFLYSKAVPKDALHALFGRKRRAA